MKTAAQHDSKWELIMAESTKGSWKDKRQSPLLC